MRVEEYLEIVRQSDRTVGRPPEMRSRILRYGLAGEIGSVIAAVKKRLLDEEGVERWSEATDAITEELGDILWYCFALDRLEHPTSVRNVLATDIAHLREEIGRRDGRALKIRKWLGEENWARFLAQADRLADVGDLGFTRYQKLAFLTARTQERELAEVCLIVLAQLGAELLRLYLPPIEIELNQTLPIRPTENVVGEIVWHISALASLFELRLSEIAGANAKKLMFRLDRSERTPLHDSDDLPGEQLPRRFDIHILTTAPGRSQMFLDGKRFGNELTDNAYQDDGYRFHDVLHLANMAMLGWSPVLRGLMRRKRKKSEPKKDEVEDGARAIIVEEAVIKLIHSEGVRVARERDKRVRKPVPLFANRDEITFAFLKLIRTMVAGLEPVRNRDWEWEDAIMAGHEVFYQLRVHHEGTISVDLEARTIEFSPEVPDKIRSMAAATNGDRPIA